MRLSIVNVTDSDLNYILWSIVFIEKLLSIVKLQIFVHVIDFLYTCLFDDLCA